MAARHYAGSLAHKKYDITGSRPRMTTRVSTELHTSIARHYSSSYTDRYKQANVNLFLGVYRPWEHPPLVEPECDSWVHHRCLKYCYDPGKWWEGPLNLFGHNIRLLRQIDLTTGQRASGYRLWFNVVHRVWKITSFEKLLSSLDSTFVSINASEIGSEKRTQTTTVPMFRTLSATNT